MATYTKAEVIALGDAVEGDLIRSVHQGAWGDYAKVTGAPRHTPTGTVTLPTTLANGESSRLVGDATITRVYRKHEVAA